MSLSKQSIARRVLPTQSERGQAMVFTLVFSAATALVALFLFNSGMMANAKTRLQNAADAGAYSAGVLQARDHNFAAYTNRSMIANQVAVAQLVSLKSYLEDAADQHDRMGSGILKLEADWIPVEKSAWDHAEAVPIPSINAAYMAAAPTVVKGLDLLIRAHEAAQEAHHAATMVEMVVVADEVVKRNDPHAELVTGAFTVGRTAFQVKNWGGSTRRYSANDESEGADRFADVVVGDKSTDGFTRNRTSIPNAKWGNTEVKPCRPLPNHVSSFTLFGFGHGGGTLLSHDKKRWLALDATQGGGIQTCTFWYPCITGICTFTESTNLFDGNFGLGGSGGGLAGQNGAYDSRTGYKNNPTQAKQYGGALILPPMAIPANIRYYTDGPGDALDEGGGLQDYYRDVADVATKPADQSAEKNGAQFSVTFEVVRKDETIRTSSRFLPDADKLKIDGGMKSGKMKALASAQAYFYRPQNSGFLTRASWTRDDNKRELANQFSPYWQSRLADRSSADRTASWELH